MAINDFFVWGKGGQKMTPDQVAREREIAQQMIGAGVDFSPVGHWTQGAARMANALVGNLRQGRADRAQQAGIDSANEAFNNSGIADLLMGGSAAPQASGGQVAASYQPSGDEVRDGIISTANSLGIDPVDLATAISYETAGTFDPTKGGPTTKWGQHRGLIQFGEPQAKQYGVDWSNPVASQLGENGAVAKYLRDTGVKPGMGLLDVYSAINAGGVGRYNRSDTAAGGAPGTVRDKVEQQMAAHRRKAEALLGGGGQSSGSNWVNRQNELLANTPANGNWMDVQRAGLMEQTLADARAGDPVAQAVLANSQQPVQVASADPNFMPDVASREIPLTALQPSPVAEALAPQATEPQMQNSPVANALAPGQIVKGEDGKDYQNVEQLDGSYALSRVNLNAGDFPQSQQQRAAPNMAAILQLANNPYLNDTQKTILGSVLQQQMQASDPLQALKIQKMQEEVNQMRRGMPNANSAFGNLDAQARAAGLQPGTPQYQSFMLNGGGDPATFRALDLQAKAAGFEPNTAEYNEFMATRGAGLSAGAAQEAKNQADISSGGAAAGAKVSGEKSVASGFDAWSDYGKLQSSIGNIDEAIAAIDGGAQSGLVYKMLPNITEASASLQNAMDRMGLDVIGSVTFGALSEGEMRLAMQTAAPRDLSPPELRNWLVRKRDAQAKAADMLADAARYLTNPNNNINGWIEQNIAKRAAAGDNMQQPSIQPNDNGGWQEINGVKIRVKQ